MNILIVSQYFSPENFRINDLADELNHRGNNITVLTSVPNYPHGKYFDGYGIFKKNKENINNINIIRSPIIPRGSGSGIRLTLNYLSFVFGAIFSSLQLINKKFDVIFVFEPSPITVCLPAIFIKKIKKIPICLWVLDLWPESVVSASNLNTKFVPSLLNPLVKYIYNKSDKILVSSKGFIDSIKKRGISKNKIIYFPQWAEEIFKPLIPKQKLLEKIPNHSFKIMFAGNIGEAQDFPSIIETAKILKNENIHWIILGSGRKQKWVKKEIVKNKLTDKFHMLGSYPLDRMPEFYAQADCMLFSLKREYIFSITIPAKVQSYLACGKPVLAMIDGEAASVIENSKAGLTCESQNPNKFAKNILKLSKLKKNELNELGNNAINFYNKEFERKMLIDKLENIFTEIT